MLPPPEALPEEAPRLANDRFVLLARAGKGGMAGVYAAWDTREQEWRAIKVLLPRFARDQGVRNRFQNEGVTMAQLSHPNLVRVFEIGSTSDSTKVPGLPFIVMELLNGGSLHRWVKTHGAMPPRLAVNAAIQLCQGLEVVHAAGVVHRDVKPKNVLCDDDNVLKLTDFGIAQLEASNETKTGLAMGTLGYMAPEQLHDAKSVDGRSDLYGLAASLWTMLTTQKPRDLFRLEDRPDLMKGVPESIRPLLVRCLAYERSDRPDSARAVADELRSILFSLPEDPPGTPDLSLHLGMPDVRNVSRETFAELNTLDGRSGVFQGGDSQTDPFGTGLDDSQPARPASGERPAIPFGGRRLGAPPVLTTDAPANLARPEAQLPPLSTQEKVKRFADQRRESDERNELPSYLVGVEPPARPDPLPPVPVQKKRGPARALGALGFVGMLLVGTPFVLGLGIAGWGATAATQIHSAEGTFTEKAQDLDRNIGYLDTLPQEVAALGVDAAPLQDTWDRWNRMPPGPERTEVAMQYVRQAEGLARPKIPDDGRTHEQELVHQRLERVERSMAQVELALRGWREATGTTAGTLAVTLRLASAPPEGGS